MWPMPLVIYFNADFTILVSVLNIVCVDVDYICSVSFSPEVK